MFLKCFETFYFILFFYYLLLLVFYYLLVLFTSTIYYLQFSFYYLITIYFFLPFFYYLLFYYCFLLLFDSLTRRVSFTISPVHWTVYNVFDSQMWQAKAKIPFRSWRDISALCQTRYLWHLYDIYDVYLWPMTELNLEKTHSSFH